MKNFTPAIITHKTQKTIIQVLTPFLACYMICASSEYADIAQLVEQLTCNQ